MAAAVAIGLAKMCSHWEKTRLQDSTETPVDSEQRFKCAGPGGCGHRRAGRERRDGVALREYRPRRALRTESLGPDLPLPDPKGLGALAANIEANGLLEEITVWGNPPQVVDGKQRERACLRAGVQPRYRRLREDIDPRDYVWAKNGARRDLTPSQKALAAAELFPGSTPGRPPAHGKIVHYCAISSKSPKGVD